MKVNPSLVDPDQYLGTVTAVAALSAHVNLPLATARPERRRLARGAVGDFVFIDCEHLKIFGRIVEVRVPEAERLGLEPKLGSTAEIHPNGRVQMLATVDQTSYRITRGIKAYPRVGDNVYVASAHVLSLLLSNSTVSPNDLPMTLGHLDSADGSPLAISAEKLFGRHCGVLGSTGGGKSWTIASLLERIKSAGGKAILFDPTGEFAGLPCFDEHCAFSEAEKGEQLVHFAYREMTEDDLFALLRPSGQTQGPKLREASRSLKLVEATKGIAPAGVLFKDGLVEKQLQVRAHFLSAIGIHSAAVNSPLCCFDATKLPEQLLNECVWSTDRNDARKWGLSDENAKSYCEQLMARCRTLITSQELACLFQVQGKSLANVIDAFLKDASKDLLRVSFRNVRFEHNTREILMNVIGRYLLGLARKKHFQSEPLVVFLDEAHQFLGRTIGDEYASVMLDAFGLIAKEGRKYGLTCVLATQRPRDIPEDVLSQLGTFIVHRLTNDGDRSTVERACGDLDRDAAAFIPTLAPGEAIIIGSDLPAPLPVALDPPRKSPDSKGPAYKTAWSERLARKAAAQAGRGPRARRV
jgi:energy-coupling factor transporter ATP-binding protein EcfA2